MNAVRPLRGEPDAVVGLLVGGGATVLFLFWSWADGGFNSTVWLPGGICVAALLLANVAASSLATSMPRPQVVAAASLAAFAAWSAASIAWAEVRGAAWDGANRAVLYALVFALFASWTWRPRVAAALGAAFAVGVAVAIGIEFAAASAADHPRSFFIDARFAAPTGYHNANAALAAIAFWPALVLAARREVPPLLRGVFAGCATLLVSLGLLSQSRASAAAFPLAACVLIALAPGRLRLLLTSGIVAGCVCVAAPAVLDVYAAAARGTLGDALIDARTRVVAASALALLLGTAAGVADRRLGLPERVTTAVGRVVFGLFVVAAVAGAGAGVAFGDPVERGRDAWAEFKSGEPRFEESGSHLGAGLGSDRYDIWRVAVEEIRRAPLRGIGAENFATAYLRERRAGIEPLYAHSLPLQILSQTGLVGAALFSVFLAGALFAALRRLLRSRDVDGAVAAAGVAMFAYWFVHASVDWLWEFPALTGPALAGLAVAGSARSRGAAARRAPARAGRVVAAAAFVVVAAVAFGVPWVAAKEVQAATRTWPADTGAAYERLGRARALNKLSDRPDLVEGAIASRRRDWARMRVAFQRAIDRNEANWYAHFELALAAAVSGDRRAAEASLRRAAALNPREPAIRALRRAVAGGRPIEPRRYDQIFLTRLRERTG